MTGTGRVEPSGPVPASVRNGSLTVTVGRAWPSSRSVVQGAPTIAFEGRDEAGLLRAGQLTLDHDSSLEPTVRLAEHARDRRLPDLERAADEGELLVHRIGRRAVVRHRDRYVKVVRTAAGAGLAERSRRGAALARAAGFAAPEVLSATPGRLDLAVVPGSPLHGPDESGGGGRGVAVAGDPHHPGPESWARAWDAWAAGWPSFAHGEDADGGLPTHTAQDELAGLRTWLGHLRTHAALPHLRDELAHRCRRLDEELRRTPADALVVSHRDLHDKQLLWDGSRLGILDLDTLALAEPACDLANLAVHAELRTHQGLWFRHQRDVVLDAIDRVAGELEVSPRRLRAYAEATRLRLTMLYAFRPRWAPFMAGWLHERSLIAVSST